MHLKLYSLLDQLPYCNQLTLLK